MASFTQAQQSINDPIAPVQQQSNQQSELSRPASFNNPQQTPLFDGSQPSMNRPTFNPGTGLSGPTPPSGMPAFNPPVSNIPRNMPVNPNMQQNINNNMPPPPTTSVENQALGGGGNQQQIQNFMTALGRVGAGGNNNMMASPNQKQAQAAPLYGANQPGSQQAMSYGSYNPATGNYSGMDATPQANQIAASAPSISNIQNMFGNSTPTGSYQPGAGTQLNASGAGNAQGMFNTNASNPNMPPVMQGNSGLQNFQNSMNGQTDSPGLKVHGSITPASLTSNAAANMPTFNQPQINPNLNVKGPVRDMPTFTQNPISTPNLAKTPVVAAPSIVPPTSSLLANNLNVPAIISDENAKKNIEDGEKNIDQFLSHMTANSYEYKDKADGRARYVSPMAQDIESTKAGKGAVIERADGMKMIDYGRLQGVMLSAMGQLHDRLKNLEKK